MTRFALDLFFVVKGPLKITIALNVTPTIFALEAYIIDFIIFITTLMVHWGVINATMGSRAMLLQIFILLVFPQQLGMGHA